MRLQSKWGCIPCNRHWWCASSTGWFCLVITGIRAGITGINFVEHLSWIKPVWHAGGMVMKWHSTTSPNSFWIVHSNLIPRPRSCRMFLPWNGHFQAVMWTLLVFSQAGPKTVPGSWLLPPLPNRFLPAAQLLGLESVLWHAHNSSCSTSEAKKSS